MSLWDSHRQCTCSTFDLQVNLAEGTVESRSAQNLYNETNFFIMKPTIFTNFPNLLRHEILHVSGRTILVLLESCLQTCMTYNIAECTVNKFLMMGRGTARNM